MGAKPPLLERSDEIDLVLKALKRAKRPTGRGALVLFEGPAGIGKSSILETAGEHATSMGFTVVAARGIDIEQEYGWGLVRKLFAPAVRTDGIPVARSGAEPALELITGHRGGAAPPSGEYALIHSLVWLTSDLAQRQPLLMVVDDMHWSDMPSLRFLAYLAARLDDVPVVVVGAARPGVERLEHIVSVITEARAVTVRTLQPFSAVATATVLAEDMRASPEAWLVARCQELTGGNPLLLRELARHLAESGGANDVREILETSIPGISRYVTLQMHRLPEEARRIVQAIAVLGDQATAERIAVVAGVQVKRVLESVPALRAGGFLTEAGPNTTHRIRHPLISAAIIHSAPAADTAMLHVRAAHSSLERDDVEIAASHLLRVPAGLADFDAAGVLLDAAERCLQRGATHGAAAYLRRRLEEDLGAERRAALARLGQIEAYVDTGQAIKTLSTALSLHRAGEEYERLIVALVGAQFHAGQLQKALQTVQAALDASTLSESARRSMFAWLMLVTHYVRADLDPETVARDLRHLPPDSSVGGLMLEGALALRATFDNRRDVALMHVERALSGNILIKHQLVDSTMVAAAWWALAASDAPLASEHFDRAISHARQTGSLRALSHAHCYRAPFLLGQGELLEALRDCEIAWEAALTASIDIALPSIRNYYAQALVACGRHRDAERLFRRNPTGQIESLKVLDADGRLALLLEQGQLEEVVTLAQAVRRSCEIYTMRTPTFADWRTYLVQAMYLLGRGEEAKPIAEEGLQLGREWGTPRFIGRGLRTAAVLETGDLQIELLTESVRVLRGSSARYELAQSEYLLGDALRRAKRHQDARKHLQAALDRCEQCGAAPLKRDAADALKMIGVRPITTVPTGVGALTPGETRVVHLAVDGMSNRDIAQKLFVTVKTVELHLSNAFRKLGVSRRKDLVRVLATETHRP